MATLRNATEADVPLILRFIRELAEYERLAHDCVATEESVRETLFGERRYAEVLIAEHEGEPAGFALFFHNYSTFLARPGIYLEDLYVRPELRGHGIGKVYHEDPQVLHYGRAGEGLVLKPGMTFTVEPMINEGQRHTKLLPDGWTVVTKDRKLSAQWEHTIVVTSTGVEILTRLPGDDNDL